ncbi:MAG TPA: glycosyltransferase [Acidimicrobiales bacterium]
MGAAVVTVVLVHWNQAERCATTIDAFQHQGVPVRLVVVDNGSTPTMLARLRQVVASAPGPVELVELGRNTGFGPAANAGFRHWLGTSGDDDEWVGLAPHDALPAEGTLEALVAAAGARPRAGLACADVGAGETPVFDPYFGGMTVPSRVTGPGWETVDYPHGTLLIARRAMLDEIGLFDERYFAYCEETDLGLRAQAAGWEVGLVHGVMVHNPSMRSGSAVTDYLMHRNTLLLVRDHSGRYHVFIRFCIAVEQLVRGLVQPSYNPWIFSARGRARGMVDFLRGRFGPPPASMLADAVDQQQGLDTPA